MNASSNEICFLFSLSVFIVLRHFYKQLSVSFIFLRYLLPPSFNSDQIVGLKCVDDCHGIQTECRYECDVEDYGCQIDCEIALVDCMTQCPCQARVSDFFWTFEDIDARSKKIEKSSDHLKRSSASLALDFLADILY